MPGRNLPGLEHPAHQEQGHAQEEERDREVGPRDGMAAMINIGPVVGGRSWSTAEFEGKRRGVPGKYCGQLRLRRARPELGVGRSHEHRRL